jgi:hypothetical protein
MLFSFWVSPGILHLVAGSRKANLGDNLTSGLSHALPTAGFAASDPRARSQLLRLMLLTRWGRRISDVQLGRQADIPFDPRTWDLLVTDNLK